MEKVCEEINYVACSILSVAGFTLMSVAAVEHEVLFFGPAAVALFLAFSHFVAMMASRERQRASNPPDNVRG